MQVRVEVLNVTNTPLFRGPETNVGRFNYGVIDRQRGFSRLTQLTFRLMF